MKKWLVVLITILLMISGTSLPAQALEGYQTHLPIIFNNFSPNEPVWIKNPNNLPPANGWPGYTGDVKTVVAECDYPSCDHYTSVENPPDYLIIWGETATFPHLLGMGNWPKRCFAVVVSESYAWINFAIWQHSTYPMTFRWMAVDSPQAPPLEWLAQAKVEVMTEIPWCTDPDLGVYARPSRLR